MTDYQVTLSLPEYLYDRARRAAEQNIQSIEEVLISSIETGLPDDDVLPADEQAELDALAHLSDDALWTIAREQMSADLQARMQVLMDKNTQGQLDASEHEELEELVERGDRLTLRKAEAAALLTGRGYKLTPKDLASRNE